MKHVYANSATDWFVAESPEHAAALAIEADKKNDIYDEGNDYDFELVPDDQLLSMFNNDGSDTTTKKTAREWADENEPGFLMTTNY